VIKIASVGKVTQTPRVCLNMSFDRLNAAHEGTIPGVETGAAVVIGAAVGCAVGRAVVGADVGGIRHVFMVVSEEV
jgi:hypothetical protein